MNTLLKNRPRALTPLLWSGFALLAVSLLSTSQANATITHQLDIGTRGSDVSELQQYLTAHPNLYPSGMITGYFGRLTEGGVQKYQVSQGIVSSGTPKTTGYGRVGPTTMNRLNASISGAGTSSGGGVSGPGGAFGDAAISPLGEPVASIIAVQYGSTSATFSWATNEVTQGQVYYDTKPMLYSEETDAYQTAYINGAWSFDGGNSTAHAITLPNLQPNTTYYYMIRSVDSSNNAVISQPGMFRTNQ